MILHPDKKTAAIRHRLFPLLETTLLGFSHKAAFHETLSQAVLFNFHCPDRIQGPFHAPHPRIYLILKSAPLLSMFITQEFYQAYHINSENHL